MSLLTAPVKDVAHLMVIRNKSDLDRMIAWAWELSLLVEGGEDEPRDLLEKHGDSQSDMTDVAARPTINAILNGKRRLTRDMIERMMKKYGVSGDFFYS